ncbi:DUF4167 domain-containing protein [Azospirillum sp. B506]|uniref:DUF4167 domain-containing protein n=1 Tax=Azospirillum sp. B506 TaxID=137721 RepID=UPI0027D78915|nr:DUF4167 domain-containing protein [Azospirillum sp. B506]
MPSVDSAGLNDLSLYPRKSVGPMPPSRPRVPVRPNFSKPRSATAASTGVRPAPARVNGSTLQKETQWLARAVDAECAGDGVEAELCRQYAEHWFRVSRGQD